MSGWKDGFEEYPWCPSSTPCPVNGGICKICQQVVRVLDQMEGSIIHEKKRHDETFDKLQAALLQKGEMEEKIAALNTAFFIDSEQIKLTVRVNDALYALNSLPFNKGKWTAEEIEKINADAQKLKALFAEKRVEPSPKCTYCKKADPVEHHGGLCQGCWDGRAYS